MKFGASLVLACGLLKTVAGEEMLFQDNFAGTLKPGWSFLRENRDAWRVGANALQIRIEPGNMWGGANDGKNVIIRQAPDPSGREVEVTVTVASYPTAQYEQVDLVWYYDDSNMVKLGLELVDGKLSIVMGREENDRTRTIALVAAPSNNMQLRHRVKSGRIRGEYRAVGASEWARAGECDLPARGAPKLALQCYQGPSDAEHWATIRDFTARGITP